MGLQNSIKIKNETRRLLMNKLEELIRAELYSKDMTMDYSKNEMERTHKNLQRTKNSIYITNEKTREDSNSHPKRPRSLKNGPSRSPSSHGNLSRQPRTKTKSKRMLRSMATK